MKIQRSPILLAVCIGATSLGLTACGGSSRPPISIALSTAPPANMQTGTPAPVTATVTNDSSNAGVDWSVTCGSAGACGSFSSAHTASGTATTYTAPAAVPTGNSVTITATSTADKSKSVPATVTITLPPRLAAGNYVFNLVGLEEPSGNPYSVAGVFTSDGNGNITGGEQDFDNLSFTAFNAISGGSSTIGPDGRGTITLNTGNTSVGVNGTETIDFALVNGGMQGFVTEFDSFGSASGDLSLQTVTSFSSSTLAQGFAFAMLGEDFSGFPLTWGGVLNVDSPGGISGAGSVSDEDDAGLTSLSQTISGTVASPDSFGRVTFSVNPAFASGVTISGYISDASHVALVETDGVLGVTGGAAMGQGAGTGTFNNSSLNGTVVFNGGGADPAGDLAAAGLVTADGTGNIRNGILDVESAGTPTTAPTSGTYAVDASGTGRGVITLNSNATGLTTFVTYMVGGGNPAFVLNMDSTSLTSGLAFAQSGAFTASTFKGSYGLGWQNPAQSATGQIASDGVSTVSGHEDVNFVGTPVSGLVFTGTFTANSNGQFPVVITSISPQESFDFFLASGSLGVFIETDANGQIVGIFVLQ